MSLEHVDEEECTNVFTRINTFFCSINQYLFHPSVFQISSLSSLLFRFLPQQVFYYDELVVYLDSVSVGLEDHVELEPLVLGPVNVLLILDKGLSLIMRIIHSFIVFFNSRQSLDRLLNPFVPLGLKSKQHLINIKK